MKREPAVAGIFYEGNPARLDKELKTLLENPAPKIKAKGIIAPHAGFVYSGKVAGRVYSSIEMPDTFVLIGPDHKGFCEDLCIMSEGEWDIPTGEVSIDTALALKIKENVPILSENSLAHAYEHSLEVQVPFIKHLSATAKIVPILIKHAGIKELKAVGEGIAKAVSGYGHKVVIVASSDMSHYVTDETARQKDKMAIDEVLRLDPEGLFAVVAKNAISMCGVLPACAMLYACLSLGAKEARLIDYDTSAAASGDHDRVVGYAGIAVI